MTTASIETVHARQIFDSRGRPTVEVDVVLADGSVGRAAAPSGASTGAHEARELRDEDARVYAGRGVLRAVANVDTLIGPALKGLDARDQPRVDQAMCELDGTLNLSRLGANAVVGVSMAVCRAAAYSEGRLLYERLAELAGVAEPQLPLPMVNILSGGAHANRSMDIQDVLAIAVGADSFGQSLAMISAVRDSARSLLLAEGQPVLLADEGGFAPGFASVEEALSLMVRAIEHAGFAPGTDVALGLDIAATQFQAGPGTYRFARGEKTLSSRELAETVTRWIGQFPIVSVEDPLGEDDWSGWAGLTRSADTAMQWIGDDLFCTDPVRIQRGIEEGVANAVLIKINQIGTLTRTLQALSLARANQYRTIVSARSGETEDAFIADLAVGTAAGQIKIGSLSTSERLAKYNQLVRIGERLPPGRFATGRSLFSSGG
jgi:enolase